MIMIMCLELGEPANGKVLSGGIAICDVVVN